MNYYNSTQRKDYNNVLLNYMIEVRSNERNIDSCPIGVSVDSCPAGAP